MKRKINILMLFIFLGIFASGENPLRGYVDDESFKTGTEIFQEEQKGIFTEAAALSNSEEELKRKFPEVISVVKTSGAWNGTFYFSDGGKTKRKTIRGNGMVKGEESNYAVTVFNEGIRVRDIVTGLATEIKIKSR